MAVLEELSAWMPRQRWFAGKEHEPRLRILDATMSDGTATTTYLVMDDAGSTPALYQVPVVASPDAPPDLADAVIGHGDGVVLIDAPRHPEFAVALLERMGVDTARVTGSWVMRGEQSNTSIVYTEDGVPTIIAKLFRALHHGENPDVTIQSALSAAGSPFVPLFLGQVTGSWPDVGRGGGRAEGTLGFAQEFLEGARDGWSIALDEARANRTFADAATDLGAAVASVHGTLAEVMPTRAAGTAEIVAMTGAWARRLDIAAAEVPAIAARRAEIDAVYAAARGAAWPRLQRIHGDLHLGQVLAVPDRGWRIVDFEGEPLRPMDERDVPDIALRDVAGMLRSFDYAAGACGQDRSDWVGTCRRLFVESYAAQGGLGGDPLLLEALELDKAVYESIYESRNRPTWLGIPLAGVDAILARTRG